MSDVPVGQLEPVRYVETRTVPMSVDARGEIIGMTSYVDTVTTSVHPDAPAGALDDELPLVWRQLGYRTEKTLGVSGGQATVWRGRTPDGGPMAIRRSGRHTVPEVHRMQVDVLASLAHPNVVRSLERPLEEGYYRWELLEYCAKGSLSAVQHAASPPALDRGEGPLNPLPRAKILAVARQVAEALHYLHGVGYVHADVKPDNVLVRGDDTFALADFTSAVSVHHPVSADATGRTAQYTPRDTVVTPAWDWNQLGLLLVTLATGNRNPAFTFDDVPYEELDPTISWLVQGLLVAEPDLRWGYHQVDRWLNGENVPLEGTLPTRRRREGGFEVQVWDVTCTTPEQIGETLASRWSAAVRLMQEASPEPDHTGETWLEWLGRAMSAVDSRGTEISRLARLRTDEGHNHPDRILLRVVTVLNPTGVPRYWVSPARTVELTQTSLAVVASEALAAVKEGQLDDASIQCVLRLFDLKILALAGTIEGYHWLGDLDHEWYTAYVQTGVLLSQATNGAEASRQRYQRRLRDAGAEEDSLFALQRGDWERYARGDNGEYRIDVLANLLLALVDGRHAQQLETLAAAADADVGATERWFHEIRTRPLARRAAPPGAAHDDTYGSATAPTAARERRPNVFRRAWRRLVGRLTRH